MRTPVLSLWVLSVLSLTLATSPWRVPQGQLQEGFQRPTYRPRSTAPPDNRNSVANLNSVIRNDSVSSTAVTPDKSYKTFYRVFYGTPPPPNPSSDRRSTTPRSYSSSQQRSLDRSSQEIEDIRAANEHFLQVRTRFKCGVPAPRVVRVQDLYPDPSQEYMPRCAVLHRCADDVGCCDNDAFHCVPRAVQEVALSFYVISVRPGTPGLSNSLEKLLFQNHTQCECQDINDIPRSGVAMDGFHGHATTTRPPSSTTTKAPTTTSTPSSTTTTSTTSVPVVAGPNAESTWRISKCRECPVPFHRREYSDGRCSCDCFDRDKPCLKVKRGKEQLEEVERKCVEVGHCHIPDCEYGDYEYDTGRCPKRPDNYKRPPEGKGYVSSSHKWNYLERD